MCTSIIHISQYFTGSTLLFQSRITDWKKYKYNDLQIWAGWTGVGFGQMYDKNGIKSFRFKTGVGLLGYLTYDYTSGFDIPKHNIGLIGVLPIAFQL